MILNEQVPGFPPWPFIESLKGNTEYLVHGTHISFGRYGWTVWVMDLTTHLLFFYTWYLIFTAKTFERMFEVFGAYFFVYLMAVTLIPIPRLLCRYVYPCKSRVRFTRQGIIIRGKRYELHPNLSIQFRANRSPLSERGYARLQGRDQSDKLRGSAVYKLAFRQVEMIYGARIVPITSVADTELAHQYAVALQIAFDLVGSNKNFAPAHPRAHGSEREEVYPE